MAISKERMMYINNFFSNISADQLEDMLERNGLSTIKAMNELSYYLAIFEEIENSTECDSEKSEVYTKKDSNRLAEAA